MQGLRHAFRLFAKFPGFTLIVVVTLALGIGANTAVFSIVYGTLLHPLPYKQPDRLINIIDSSMHESELAKVFASYSDFEEFSRHARTLESVGAETWAGRPGAVLIGRGPAKSYLTIPVTAGFFNVLGVAPQLGRTFTNGDLTGGCAIILSNKFWRGPIGSDPRIVGQSLSLDDQSCTVLGVMPARFAVYPPETQIWTLILPNDPRLNNFFGVFIIARLKPGVPIAQARAELKALHTALHEHDIKGEKQFTPLVSGLQEQFTWLAGRNLRTTLAVVFASVMLVLLIACLNIANLLLARSLARGREFAVRVALGAGGRRLVGQLLVESGILSLTGGAVGLLVAFVITRYFVHVQPVELPVGSTISIGLPALGFAASVSILTTLIFAVTPAWVISRRDVFSSLRVNGGDISPARQRISRVLVSAEMALSVILLVGAVLLMRSILSFESAPLGFARANILAANGSLPREYREKTNLRLTFYENLQQNLSRVPGVTNVAVASTLPPYGLGLGTAEVEGKPVPENSKLHDVGDAAISADYFRLFNIPIHLGRAFDQHDQPHSDHVAVVNEAFAREYFSRQNPIGQRIRIGEEREWMTVVGVVGNEKRPTVYEEMQWVAQPIVYRPVTQYPPEYFAIAVRSTDGQSGLGHAIEQAVASTEAQAALGDIEPMQSRLAPYLKYPRFRAVVLGAFSCLAVILAAVGLYGVLAQFVAQRTAEIGVRIALGARTADIVRLIIRVGGAPALAGLFAGFIASLVLTRYLSSLLYSVTPTDPSSFAVVLLVMLTATVIAMLRPLSHASRVDPMTALRSE